MMRPIFSPADFVQIKAEELAKNTFEYTFKNRLNEDETQRLEKMFINFDFFANCEYFEDKFNYDEKLKLPIPKKVGGEGNDVGIDINKYTSYRPDPLMTVNENKSVMKG